MEPPFLGPDGDAQEQPQVNEPASGKVGTPTAKGTFTFNLTVRDQDGQPATQVTTITIN